MAKRVRSRIGSRDFAFLTDSMLLTVGIALARVLGFGFSFILARKLSPDNFGFIQYSITVGGLVAVGTQPFVQHVLARFVAKNQNDSERLAQTLHATWFILLGATALTILIAVPLLVLSNHFHIGVMVIFIGQTLFYCYYGLARGFMASRRLLAAYLGSNFVQLIAIIVFYELGSTQSPTPALLIYGLSYLIPIAALQVWRPLPLKLRFGMPDKAITFELLRFTVPVWISHATYIFFTGMDVLLVERYMDTGSVGVYTLTKTLSLLFSFVPIGLNTILMPKIAASPANQHIRLLKKTLFFALLANGAALLVFVLTYRWFVGMVFGESYILPTEVMLMLVIAEILFGFHGIITSMFVGGNKPHLETISRTIILIFAFVTGVVLIPQLGLLGAGLMLLSSAFVAIITYASVAVFYRKRLRNELTNA
jgi:O-antigen/teichoic acid export membrane protein